MVILQETLVIELGLLFYREDFALFGSFGQTASKVQPCPVRWEYLLHVYLSEFHVKWVFLDINSFFSEATEFHIYRRQFECTFLVYKLIQIWFR